MARTLRQQTMCFLCLLQTIIAPIIALAPSKLRWTFFSLTQPSFFSHFHASHPLLHPSPSPRRPHWLKQPLPACEPVFTHPRVKFHWPQQLAGCAYYSFIIITNNQLGLLLKEKTPLLQGRIRLSEHWCKSILYTLRSFVMLHEKQRTSLGLRASRPKPVLDYYPYFFQERHSPKHWPLVLRAGWLLKL